VSLGFRLQHEDVSYGSEKPPLRVVLTEVGAPESREEASLPAIGYLSRVMVGEQEKILRMPVKYETERHGKYVSVFAPSLSLHGAGRTLDEAERMLAQAIVDNWRELEGVESSALHSSAIVLRHRLRQLIRR
jgi:hypothetical protein